MIKRLGRGTVAEGVFCNEHTAPVSYNMTSNAAAVLHPITEAHFFSEIWERKHRHIKRNNSAIFESLISVERIHRYLATQAAFHPTVQLVHSSESIAPSEYTDAQRKINPVALDDYFLQGATVVLSQAHQHFEELAALSRDVAKQFQMRAQTNVYLSPPGNQGFRSHYDTHDVFILQVSGRKRFRFYRSDVALPFPDDKYDPEQNPHKDVTEEVLLESGDTLYIPRGLVHDAVAMPDASSLHITLGVFPIIVRDILQSCVQVAAEHDVLLRETLALNRTESQVLPHPDVNTVQEKILRCLTPEMLSEAYSRALDDVAIESVPLCQSMFQRQSISTDSTVSIVQDAVFGQERQGSTLKLRLHGQIMSFDEPLSTAVEQLLESGPIPLHNISGLNVDQQLALCAHLQKAHALNVQNT